MFLHVSPVVPGTLRQLHLRRRRQGLELPQQFEGPRRVERLEAPQQGGQDGDLGECRKTREKTMKKREKHMVSIGNLEVEGF